MYVYIWLFLVCSVIREQLYNIGYLAKALALTKAWHAKVWHDKV